MENEIKMDNAIEVNNAIEVDNTINMECELNEIGKIVAQHGYHKPIPVGEGSFSKVYRVTDSGGSFWACRVSEATRQWQQECENWQEIRHPLFPG